jgi:hypothetical protein
MPDIDAQPPEHGFRIVDNEVGFQGSPGLWRRQEIHGNTVRVPMLEGEQDPFSRAEFVSRGHSVVACLISVTRCIAGIE